MPHGLTLIPLVAYITPSLIAAVYLWSEDPGRRERALQLLRMILLRRQ